MKILVTGGAGFIGAHIVDRLVDENHEVIIIDNFSTGKRENINPKAKLVEADISEYGRIEKCFRGVEAVFHTAALARILPSVKNPLPSHDANVTGTLNVLWAARNAGVKKVIYSGSSSAYGDQDKANYPLSESLTVHPGSPYALQKFMGERYCQLFSELYNLPTVILRYFNVYGPRQLTAGAYATVIGIFFQQKIEGKPMTVVSDGWERRRDYTYITDIVEGNLQAWHRDVAPGEVINLGYGKDFSIREITEMIGGETTEIDARPWEYALTLADNTKAKKLLGWQPRVSLEEGIQKLKVLYDL